MDSDETKRDVASDFSRRKSTIPKSSIGPAVVHVELWRDKYAACRTENGSSYYLGREHVNRIIMEGVVHQRALLRQPNQKDKETRKRGWEREKKKKKGERRSEDNLSRSFQ